MKRCELCGEEVNNEVERCPRCGTEIKPLPFGRADLYAILGAIFTVSQVLAPAGFIFSLASVSKTKKYKILAILSIVFSSLLTLAWLIAAVFFVAGVNSVRNY